MSVAAILVVIVLLGFGHSWLAIWVLPLGFLTGLTFAGFGLIMTALARNYDFFTYSLTLFQTPMLLLSGVFFPVDQMPAPLQAVAAVLPLSHAIDIARPLLTGQLPANLFVHVAVLVGYAVGAYYIALVLTRRRLLK
jgi:lipooligosaccharide transport system permease protein